MLDNLNSLLMFPPEPINVILRYGLAFLMIQFLIASHTLSSTKLLINLTVPILKDFEQTRFPSFINVNSVLPPPTSTKRKVF